VPVALCIRCGGWKQSPLQRCPCGFAPARGTGDEAKSVVLSEQFRSAPELEVLARVIREGGAVAYDEGELRRAGGAGRRNVAVNLGLLAVALALGLLIAGAVGGLSPLTLGALGAALAVAVAITWVALARGRRRADP
jgi:hypothetical protein